MAVRLDVKQFMKDFVGGVRDKDLLSRHGITAKEMIQVVKKLMNEGFLTKEQYLGRNKRIKEMEAQEEKQFLASLYHCPVCGHIQPIPFEICPACGTDVPEYERARAGGSEMDSGDGSHTPETHEPSEPIAPETAVEGPSAHDAGMAPPESEVMMVSNTGRTIVLNVDRVSRGVMPENLPDKLLALVGTGLDDASVTANRQEHIHLTDYRITAVLANSPKAGTFKAEDSQEQGPPVAVKILHSDAVGEADINEVVDAIVEYQSNMDDPNVVTLIGTAYAEGKRALVYEYMPLDLETVFLREPEGMDLDLLTRLLRQISSGLGYCHTHRGKDGVVRRLPHLNLKPSKILFDEEREQVKIEDCGVTKAFIDVRGHKHYMWEEPGADFAALSPETFVMDGKFVKPIPADIYALGVILYKLATGKSPYEYTTLDEYRFAHLKRHPIPPIVHRYDLPPWLDQMILKCLAKEPGERWRSATQMELAIGKNRSV
ncbi:MAG: protein kinase [Pseudomonadota bacterium]